MGDEKPQVPTMLDKIIADAIEKAKTEARDEVLRSIAELGGADDIRRMVSKEAERVLREDPEVNERIKAALLRALDTPEHMRARRW